MKNIANQLATLRHAYAEAMKICDHKVSPALGSMCACTRVRQLLVEEERE